jgi:hypothetical protein
MTRPPKHWPHCRICAPLNCRGCAGLALCRQRPWTWRSPPGGPPTCLCRFRPRATSTSPPQTPSHPPRTMPTTFTIICPESVWRSSALLDLSATPPSPALDRRFSSAEHVVRDLRVLWKQTLTGAPPADRSPTPSNDHSFLRPCFSESPIPSSFCSVVLMCFGSARPCPRAP